MARRKGEITRISSANGRITLRSPAEKVRDPVNRDVIFCAAGVLSATPVTYSLRRDDSDFVFCFAKPEARPLPSASLVSYSGRLSLGGVSRQLDMKRILHLGTLPSRKMIRQPLLYTV
jgi:hypothetical protein